MKFLRRWDVKTWAWLLGGTGVLMLTAAGFLGGYFSSLLLEIGAALFLAIPLVLLEDILENVSRRQQETVRSLRSDLHEVTREVQEARTEIEEIGRATRERIAAERDADVEASADARAHPTEQNVWRLLRRAHALGATDPGGIRVQLPGSDLRMRFAAQPAPAAEDGSGSVAISVEQPDSEPVAGPVAWGFDQPVEQVLPRLASELQTAGRYPGDESFDAAAIFSTLIDALDRVIALRTGRVEGARLPAVVEVQGVWVLTVDGLAHTTRHERRVAARDLLTEREQALAALGDGEPEQDGGLDEAMSTAAAFFSGRDRRRARERLGHG